MTTARNENDHNQPLGSSLVDYYPTNTGLGDLSSFDDIWNSELTNIVMGDFDFEETTASNFGPSFASHEYETNQTWSQPVSTFAASDVENTRPTVITDERVNPEGMPQDAQTAGELGIEVDWMQSLFWNSIGSYS